MSFIHVITQHKAKGRLKDIYDDLIIKRGKLARVHQLQSLNPESIVDHMDLYMTVMFGNSPLKRAQREMIAVVVSAANKCAYCMTHHGAALNKYWKDEERVEKLKVDFYDADLTAEDRMYCEYAWDLTREPGSYVHEQQVKIMQDNKISDRKILDVALVISYFNFVNRMVLGLGAELEDDNGKGYDY